MKHRRHSMPFGAEVLADGCLRCRLWAPAARRVDLLLLDRNPETALPMAPEAEGWFGLTTELAGPGTPYLFRIDGGQRVPDPASRRQAEDVHGPSLALDPAAFAWSDGAWRGRPWHEAVIYELHIGAFTPQGSLQAAKERLDYLAELGVTAIQLMPVAEFPGRRNWGYDGALKFAVESAYGSPEDLKDFVQAAHALGLMVFLDVVYNHFGPEGNYLHLYAPAFFTGRYRTPWGDAIDFDGGGSRWVRRFFIDNALYWLEEYHLDGLRLDAVHAIFDSSRPDIVEELADTVEQKIGNSRAVHLVLENDNNAAHYLDPVRGGYAAQWNDDLHHALHVLLTGERHGYYADFADRPMAHLGRCLCQGYAFQGEDSAYRGGRQRGEPSGHLPPTAFVGFLQNHDQVGNRAHGERIASLAPADALRVATAILLLAPSPPLLFMGQEWGSRQPFLFFCDFAPDLAEKVAEGRRRMFAGAPPRAGPSAGEAIADPSAISTYRQSALDWRTADTAEGRRWLDWHRHLLQLRLREIVPRLVGIRGGAADYRLLGERALQAHWRLGDGARLLLLANLGGDAVAAGDWPPGRLIFAEPQRLADTFSGEGLPAWSVAWFVQEPPP